MGFLLIFILSVLGYQLDGPTGPDIFYIDDTLEFVDRPPCGGYMYDAYNYPIEILRNISWVVKFKTKKFCKKIWKGETYYFLCTMQDVRGFNTKEKAIDFFNKKGQDGILVIKL